MQSIRQSSIKTLKDNTVRAILFDGRKDNTKTMVKKEDGKYHPSEEKEEHYSICSEPGGDYLTHLTLDPEDRAVDVRPAKQLASLIYQWLCDNQMEESLQAIGGDSTNVNTGWKGGAIAHLETMLGRKMIWIICALHTNELPLRHLFISMDGRTVSDNKFEGPIGKLINKVLELPVLHEVPPPSI